MNDSVRTRCGGRGNSEQGIRGWAGVVGPVKNACFDQYIALASST